MLIDLEKLPVDISASHAGWGKRSPPEKVE